jgi:hypothetical protein
MQCTYIYDISIVQKIDLVSHKHYSLVPQSTSHTLLQERIQSATKIPLIITKPPTASVT